MAVFALISPGGSPGVTTTALALALTWPKPVVVAECDPSGGDILAGLFAGHLKAPRGLLGVAFEAGRGPSAIATELSTQLVPLDDTGSRSFLAGISDPRQALGLSPVWPGIAVALGGLEADVIADCGRFDAGGTQPLGVLAEADAVLMVMRPTLRQVAAARPRVDMVTQVIGTRDKLSLMLIGDKGVPPVDISRTLEARVIASLPEDASTARVLSDGAGRRSRLDRTPLMRAAKPAGRSLAQQARPLPMPELAVPAFRGPFPERASERDAAWTDERGASATSEEGRRHLKRADTGGFRGVIPPGQPERDAAWTDERQAGAGGSGGSPPGRQSGGSSPRAGTSPRASRSPE